MDFNTEVRLKQLQSLDNFISCSRDKVQSILDCLQWNNKDTLKESSLIKCSIDPSHRVSAHSADAHISKCFLHKEGYNESDSFLSEPLNNPISSLHIDDNMKVEIFSAARQNVSDFKSGWNGQDPDPLTSDRLFATYSRDERLVLYDYAVTNTTGPLELPEFNTLQPINNEGTTLTEEELLKRERDAKRRRIKYKSVHTNHKNYTEIIREVIHGQMELYCDWINGTEGGETMTSYDDNVTCLVKTEDSVNYAESNSKHSNYLGSSAAAKYNDGTGTYSNSHSYKYSRYSHDRESSDNSYRNRRSRSRHKYSDRRHEHTNGYKKYRSRSRSSSRHGSRRRRRSRSRSRHKHYSRHRR